MKLWSLRLQSLGQDRPATRPPSNDQHPVEPEMGERGEMGEVGRQSRADGPQGPADAQDRQAPGPRAGKKAPRPPFPSDQPAFAKPVPLSSVGRAQAGPALIKRQGKKFKRLPWSNPDKPGKKGLFGSSGKGPLHDDFGFVDSAAWKRAKATSAKRHKAALAAHLSHSAASETGEGLADAGAGAGHWANDLRDWVWNRLGPTTGARIEPSVGAGGAAAAIAPPMLPSLPSPGEIQLTHLLKREERAAVVVVAAFVVFMLAWSALAPLSSAAIAQGVISPDTNRKTVQHLEGGIVKQILVRDGDVVAAGAPLVVLDNTLAETSYQVLENQYYTLATQQARLAAVQAGQPDLVLPTWIEQAAADPEVRQIVKAQRDIMIAERQARAERRGILTKRVAQLQEEIKGLRSMVDGQTKQIAFLQTEIGNVEYLLKDGLETVPRHLALKRSEAELIAERGENLALIARAEQAIGEAELELAAFETEFQENVGRQITDTHTSLSEVTERLAASRDVLQRVEITAPVAGTVVALQVHTPGGVVQPGEPLLDIVPSEDDLLIDVRVSPTDIDVVETGLRAQVHLSAFSQRNLPKIEGTVRHVSADRLTDPATGEVYFKAQVTVDRDELRALDQKLELVAGMPAEVVIVTGEQTLVGYLMQPVSDLFRRSFRES